ncbi:MotA/TolQ/ExbB proton channel family protein [Luteithermobacter gelatinilyticus]|uniref:MotA/TolQ/ExbB proton channel family protein n=1 Tax=Luteithermobacter gelatinilyticus TaxID=2582913 RepID=UPI0011064C94|nr:MotA/TolQ/ExbB proton channel family protein [Luteithermobacter gelatinilyticus]|tara:strand:- start:5265 stop:6638 length:1374 start_codon:yes stop_codon:yes gene_type:complete
MKKLVTLVLAVALGGMASTAMAQKEVKNLDELLEIVRQGKVNETAEYRKREQEFLRNKSEQQALLNKAQAEQRAEERRSDRLEAEFKANENKLAQLQTELSEELGALKELFGVLQQVSGDARGVFEHSIISAQYPNRDEFLDELVQKTASSSKLPTIEEIERLWFEIQREMTEAGKVVAFDTTVQYPDGATEEKEVVRVGPFNLVSDGKYLEWRPQAQRVAELVRQPADRFLETAAALQQAKEGFTAFGLDPSRGSILALLIQAPSLRERIDQGGTIGYLILIVGAIGMIFIIERFIYLTIASRKVKAQISSDVVSENNPLGRVLSVYDANKEVDVETLELKLDEAIMKETPALERFLVLIKIISAVAPLMGLLGTVTGMIQTFQSMTLFGTGDPKLMAGGISQALVTTVLGITVALPTLFLHSVVAGMSKRIIHTLEEQSAGIIAVHAEQQSNKGA